MRKLLAVILVTLALNFLAAAGFVGWLYQQGRLDRQRVQAIKGVLFPKPVSEEPATQPAAEPTTRPGLRLEDLLAQQAGRPATEQVEFIQRAFDTQMALLDRRHRELLALRQQVEGARAQLQADKQKLSADQAALDAQKQQAERLAADKGFQDSLQRYEAMPPRQVKAVFMTLEDRIAVQYLQAMEARTAAKVIKECKTDEEAKWAQRIMELMRQASQSAEAPSKEAKE